MTITDKPALPLTDDEWQQRLRNSMFAVKRVLSVPLRVNTGIAMTTAYISVVPAISPYSMPILNTIPVQAGPVFMRLWQRTPWLNTETLVMA